MKNLKRKQNAKILILRQSLKLKFPLERYKTLREFVRYMAPNSKFAKMSSRRLASEFNKRIIGIKIKHFTSVTIKSKKFYQITSDIIFSAILRQKSKDVLIGRKYKCWGAYMGALVKPEDTLEIIASKFSIR